MEAVTWRQAFPVLVLGCSMTFSVATLAANNPIATQQTAATQDNDAALALKERRYERVIEITKRISQYSPSDALNWYRFSIAAARLGHFQQAEKALNEAQKNDPQLKFASSPGGVKKLRAEINEGLMPSGSTTAVSPVAYPVYKDPPQSQIAVVDEFIDPSATSTDSTVAATVAKMEVHLNNISQKLSVIESTAAQAPMGTADMVRAQNQKTFAILVTGFVLIGLLFGAGFAHFMRKQAAKIKSNKVLDVVKMPLDDLIAFNRDNAFILMERLVTHGHKETALYQSLVRSLISLEQESGKSRVNVKSLTANLALADTKLAMEPRAMVLGKDDSKQLHQSAAFKALQNTMLGVRTAT